MQISPTSSELGFGRPEAAGSARTLRDLVGRTPLYTLARSGAGHAHLKLEASNPGGSYFDRVATQQLLGLGRGDRVVVVGMDAFAVSVAAVGCQRGFNLEVLAARDQSRRVEQLLRRFGAVIRRVDDAQAASAYARACADEGALVVTRDDAASHLRALRDIALETCRALGTPTAWVVVDYGIAQDRVRRVLSFDDAYADVHFIADDREQPRVLKGQAACRRTQTAHREGILLSPVSTEVVDRTIELALDFDSDVVGIVPEGGHRYLGWW